MGRPGACKEVGEGEQKEVGEREESLRGGKVDRGWEGRLRGGADEEAEG